LCGDRKARRSCPALGHQICALCCGTKRLTQIQCPSDCAYLHAAREHPPASAVRRQQRDLSLLVQFVRDFNQRQSELFLLVTMSVRRYQPSELHPLVDDDVAEAAAALAGTYETASRGLIYEHRPPSLPAERLVQALKPIVAEAGQGTAFERDAAVVLRRLEAAVREVRATEPDDRRAFLNFLARVLARGDRGEATPGEHGEHGEHGERGQHGEPGEKEAPRLIRP
jgi:hypothetical protein